MAANIGARHPRTMIDGGKRNLLGVGVDVVDYDAAVERLLAAARDRLRLPPLR